MWILRYIGTEIIKYIWPLLQQVALSTVRLVRPPSASLNSSLGTYSAVSASVCTDNTSLPLSLLEAPSADVNQSVASSPSAVVPPPLDQDDMIEAEEEEGTSVRTDMTWDDDDGDVDAYVTDSNLFLLVDTGAHAWCMSTE